MEWTVLLDAEFEEWIVQQETVVRTRILAHANVLKVHGPSLGRPKVDTVKGSKFANMKELRVQISGDPWRVLFAFDPQREAILLVGGNKAHQGRRWYRDNIPIADARYQRHLEALEEQGR